METCQAPARRQRSKGKEEEGTGLMEGVVCARRAEPPWAPFSRGRRKPLRRGVEELRGQPVYFAGHAVFGQGRADAFAGAGEILALFRGNAAGILIVDRQPSRHDGRGGARERAYDSNAKRTTCIW